jgi:tight adherence protein C
MTPLFYCLVLITVFCGMGLLASIMLSKTARATSSRIFAVTSRGAVGQQRASSQDQLKKFVITGASWMRARLGLSDNAEMIERFTAAGMNTSASRDVYAAVRILGPVLGLGAGALLPSHRTLAMVVLAGIAYLAPDMVLQKLIKRRRKKIQLSIPDAVDLLVICVDAGLGLDQAMLRVGQELETSHPEIHDEFQQINREQRAGKPRLEAWESMAKRTALKEIDGFVNMLMQTERFGTPIARALSTFADGIRQKRRQKAEELAAKTTVKIIFPLVLFIFPSLFVVLIGPAGITIARGLAQGH